MGVGFHFGILHICCFFSPFIGKQGSEELLLPNHSSVVGNINMPPQEAEAAELCKKLVEAAEASEVRCVVLVPLQCDPLGFFWLPAQHVKELNIILHLYFAGFERKGIKKASIFSVFISC